MVIFLVQPDRSADDVYVNYAEIISSSRYVCTCNNGRVDWSAATKPGAIHENLRGSFFWALVSMFGLAGAEALVGSARLAKFQSLGFATVGIFTFGRVVLFMPAVSRPRLGAGDWSQE